MKKFILIAALLLIPASAHSLTLAELRVRSELLLSQDTAATTKKYSNIELRYWINAGARLISGLGECIERDTNVALAARVWSYNMPTRYIRLGGRGAFMFRTGSSQALDRDPTGLTPKDASAFGKEPASGNEPKEILDMGRSIKKVYVSPTPATDGDTMKVTYVAYDRTMSADSDTSDMPIDFQEIIPMYVRYRAMKKYVVDGPYWNEFVQELQLVVPTLGPIRDEEQPSARPGPGQTP